MARGWWGELLPGRRDYAGLRGSWRGDVVAGLTVGVVALPLALVTAVIVGFATARFTGRKGGMVALRQVAFTMVPAAITYAIGSAVGANI
jgi:hypothetical protein